MGVDHHHGSESGVLHSVVIIRHACLGAAESFSEVFLEKICTSLCY